MAGLYENIHKKRKRIKEGSGEKMRKAGDKGAPTAKQFKRMAKTKTHYLPSGKVYEGKTHKSGKTLMTGATHTPASKVLTHTPPKKGK